MSKPDNTRIRAFVFLGNPGRKYADTRHNAGWMICDRLKFVDDNGWKEKFNSNFQTIITSGITQLYLKPLTFMNQCGRAVRNALDFFKLNPEELLIVHDDLETAFGTIALKKGGGLGGHNGLKSVNQHLSSNEFCRIKIGISRPSGISVANWVLQPFTYDEQAVLPRVLDKAAEVITGLKDGDIIEKDTKIKVVD